MMNTRSVLLAASLVANVALVAVLLLRPASQADKSSAVASANTDHTGRAFTGARDAALRAALASGDRAALLAAGVSEDVAGQVMIGRAFENYLNRMHTARSTSQNSGRYWRRDVGFSPDTLTKEQRAEVTKAQRDFSEAVRATFGSDLSTLFTGREAPDTFLPAAKREQLHRIQQDYDDMRSEVGADQNGIELPADREKFRLLGLERDRDIASVLTPEERQQYDLRLSPTADTVRYRFGDAIQTEEQYLKVYALQKAFDDQYSNPDLSTGAPLSPEVQRARRDAEQQLQDDVRAVIPSDQLAAFQRANDPDVKTVNALTQRLNLPATTTDTVLAARDAYAAQSMDINANAALSPADRRVQLQNLAVKARNDLQATLGADGAQVYAQRSQWMNLLKGGTAFSTNPKNAPNGNHSLTVTVFPVQPPAPPRKG